MLIGIMSDSEDDTIDSNVKVAFVGESNVGKTSIIRRFCYDDFTRLYNQTVGADFYVKRLALPERRNVTLHITDIGGLELQGNMLDKYLFNSNIVVIVYDISNSGSFDCMSFWAETVTNLLPQLKINAIIGNKCDLEHQRAVRLDKTQQFVQNYNVRHFLMSAKTGESVNANLIDLIAKHMGIPLSKVEKEHHQTVVKVELVPSPPGPVAVKKNAQKNTTVCCLQ